MITVTATDIQNNFGHYLQAVRQGDEIIILKNGKAVAGLVSHESSVSFLTDSLTGVLKSVSRLAVKIVMTSTRFLENADYTFFYILLS